MFRSTWTILRELTLSLAKVTYTFVEIISNAVLWQHVFQIVVYVLGAVQRATGILTFYMFTKRCICC